MGNFPNDTRGRARAQTLEILNYKQVAGLLSLTPRTLRSYVRAGILKCWRSGKSVLFTPKQVRDFIQRGQRISREAMAERSKECTT